MIMLLGTACINFDPHETFLANMNSFVGIKADDPWFVVNQIPQREILQRI